MTKHDQLVNALRKLYPNGDWAVHGEELRWRDKEVEQPSQSELETAMAEAVEDAKKLEYRHARYKEYPRIEDVVVALAEKEEGDDTMWKQITAQRAKVKSDNPKPE